MTDETRSVLRKWLWADYLVYDHFKNKLEDLIFSIQPQQGSVQLLDLIVPELKSHVIPHKFKCSHWWKIHL